MKTVKKLNLIIVFYLGVLVLLLLSVIAIPLVIQHGLSITRTFIIEEEILETALIVILFCISYFILKRFQHTLKAYKDAIDRAGEDKSVIVSRLAEAFNYIGTVNVEIEEIQSVLCGVERYPESKREFRQLVDGLAAKAMTLAAAPWLFVRMIDRYSSHTVNEHSAHRPRGDLPSVTLGNRAILDGSRVDGLQTIATRQNNLDLMTVFILPNVNIPEEKTVLLTAILNQIEMLFLLHRAGCLKTPHPNDSGERRPFSWGD